MALGVGIVMIAQLEMGNSWRVLIPDETPSLITGGLFRYSRNPIFLGMMLMALGIALAVPHTLSWMAFAVAYVTISVQIRLEEDYLGRTLGETYKTYREQIRRWF
ncbi:methyltransferase family protein [Microvirga pakistanensis]|uniref:methyltransferase family protein n=1 Tax=Microvirga pakistanensis TaxID=1682650 RepID=UPI00106C08D2|nr:isoprenylcysteine carboxylmethyltransferase family protein [Microvirga pakistanensis]